MIDRNIELAGTIGVVCHSTSGSGRQVKSRNNGEIGDPMSKEEDYRGFAARCLDLAKSSHEAAEKSHLLAMAEAWLNLADKIARLVKRPGVRVGEHPAVRAALGPERRQAE
jgi:hypothetical protein